nr:hypothetical protein EAVNVH72_02754 [Elizabethkingia anophelis]
MMFKIDLITFNQNLLKIKKRDMANSENLKGKGFANNPQNINRKGRPRKTFNSINEYLSKKGMPIVSKSEFTELFSRIMNATEDEIRALAKAKTTPYALRIILTELGTKNRAQMVRDIRDFIFGQAKQEINHTVKARVLTPEELKQHLKDLEDNY